MAIVIPGILPALGEGGGIIGVEAPMLLTGIESSLVAGTGSLIEVLTNVVKSGLEILLTSSSSAEASIVGQSGALTGELVSSSSSEIVSFFTSLGSELTPELTSIANSAIGSIAAIGSAGTVASAALDFIPILGQAAAIGITAWQIIQGKNAYEKIRQSVQKWADVLTVQIQKVIEFASKPYVQLYVDKDNFNLADSFFHEKVYSLEYNIDLLNNTLYKIKQKVSELKPLLRGDELITVASNGDIIGKFDKNFDDDFNSLPKIMEILKDLGIVGEYRTYTKKEGKFSWVVLDPTKTTILDITSALETLNNLIKVYFFYGGKIIEMAQDVIDIFGTVINVPTPGGGTISPPQLPDNIRNPFPTMPSFPIYNPYPTVNLDDLLSGTISPTDTASETISPTRTTTKEPEEEKPKKKKPKKKNKKKKKKKKTSKETSRIQFIQADVSKYSNWLKYINFEFDTRVKKESNKKGKVTITLKNDETYYIGVFKRGIYSNSVMTLIGAGYGYWRNFNYKNLVRTDTVSYNLPRPSLNRQLKSISKEIKSSNIIYR